MSTPDSTHNCGLNRAASIFVPPSSSLLGPVRQYYYDHFSELSPDKQFHFATRIKNYFHSDDFRDYFATYTPSTDLAAILADNDFSHVNQAAARRPFFEQYDHLYAIEAALFRVNHLLNEYQIDLRPQLLEQVPLDRLYALADQLLRDDAALLTLSTWAVNTICLTEVLFPRRSHKNHNRSSAQAPQGHHTIIRTLAERALQLETSASDPLLLIYLYTHIILCDSNFYTRPVSEIALAQKMLDRCAALIEQNFDQLILDVRIEFLVCANMVYTVQAAAQATHAAKTPSAIQANQPLTSPTYPDLRARIATECRANLAHNPYLIDTRRPASYHTLDGAEHTNVLFIMSGLDQS